jgi:hypothetical protein
MKKILSIAIILLASSCYDAKTHGKFISDKQDVWIDGYAIRMNEHEQADKGLVFCQANIKEDGRANPVCTMAEFK